MDISVSFLDEEAETQMLENLHKISQLINGRLTIKTYFCLALKPMFFLVHFLSLVTDLDLVAHLIFLILLYDGNCNDLFYCGEIKTQKGKEFVQGHTASKQQS